MKKLILFLITITLLGACNDKIRYSKEFNLEFIIYKGQDTLRFTVTDTISGPGETLSSYSRKWYWEKGRKIGVFDPLSPDQFWKDVFEVPFGYKEEIINLNYRVIESYHVKWYNEERYD
jgi:hypothetical protein